MPSIPRRYPKCPDYTRGHFGASGPLCPISRAGTPCRSPARSSNSACSPAITLVIIVGQVVALVALEFQLVAL
eukprot:406766-Pyramimonas_sp.AAC.1